MNKKILILPVVALLGFLLAVRTVFETNREPPIAPAVVAPSKSPFPTFAAGVGIVEPSSESISIATNVSGVVVDVPVVVGSLVKKGDLLFSLDARKALARVEWANAALAAAQAQAADAKAQYGFVRAVTDQRAIRADDRTRKEYAVQQTQAALEQAQADLHSAQTDLDLLSVRAPIDGQVLQVRVRVGEFAQAQVASSPLMIVGRVDPLYARVDVDENDAWRIQKGAKAIAYLRGNSSLSTELRFVRFEPYVIPKRSLTGDSSERVDTRVLQLIYEVQKKDLPVYVGQLLDIFIEASPQK